MNVARGTRLGLAIAGCVGVLVLTILWNEVPATIGPCSGGAFDDPKNPYGLGTCLRGPPMPVVLLKLAIAFIAIAGVAALAANASRKRRRIAGGGAAALSALAGLVTVQAVSAQVFDVGYFPSADAVAIVGTTFFLFGAAVVWGLDTRWPNKSLERTREG
jgi:hypothetical protein